MKSYLNFLAVVFFIAHPLTAACEKHGKQSFEDNQQRWQAAKVNNYSYVMQQHCFCPSEYRQPMRVLVKNGNVVSATVISDEEVDKEVSSQVLQSLYTIQGWFGVIEDASDQNAARIDVVYDAELGFPKKIEIDMRERMVDDEQSIVISSVTKVN